MESKANFRVDTRLASLLGENYRSSEQAIKELVDNTWDADAENVFITLPAIVTDESIIIIDDGSGMTSKEVEQEYLVVASDRVSRKGERTVEKNRLVKGRKGIGKFAGLITADLMKLETYARGKKTTLYIKKEDLLNSKKDLEKIDLPIIIENSTNSQKGTTITLSGLNQNLNFPNTDKLKQLIILEYGHEKDFKVYVNNSLVDIEDIPGETKEVEINLPEFGDIRIKFSVADKNLKSPGLVIKVKGKTISRPEFFGINEIEDIPTKLSKRIYGEVEADCLENDVTSDWGAIVENSRAYEAVKRAVQNELEAAIRAKYKTEVNLARARLQKEINQRIQQLPEYKREFASQALERVMKKYWSESDEKIRTLISIILDTFEKDEYWIVIKKIGEARNSDIETFAEALNEFGIVDLVFIAQQAHHRLKYLDELEVLVSNPNSLEKDVHKAIEKNLWILGNEYSLMASNTTLKKIIQDFLNKKYKGDNPDKRPDLLLSANIFRKHLLIEFKKPNLTLTRKHESQAIEYRDELETFIHGKEIEIILMGKKVKNNISSGNERKDVKYLSYLDVISNSRTQLNWLIDELDKPPKNL